MSKTEIDYSNTIIYKITCKNSDIHDVYVGHTTNFIQRKRAHKQCCLNDKNDSNSCKLYKIIRENGGWENWKMEIIAFKNCNNHYEAREIEQEYYESLNASLNSIAPMPKPKIKIEKESESLNNKCNTSVDKESKFNCVFCNIKTDNKKDYNNHLKTFKHEKNVKKINEESHVSNNIYCCACGKRYKYSQGLSKHKKTCVYHNKEMSNKKQYTSTNQIEKLSGVIFEVVKQNQDFKDLLIEQSKKILEFIKEKSK